MKGCKSLDRLASGRAPSTAILPSRDPSTPCTGPRRALSRRRRRHVVVSISGAGGWKDAFVWSWTDMERATRFRLRRERRLRRARRRRGRRRWSYHRHRVREEMRIARRVYEILIPACASVRLRASLTLIQNTWTRTPASCSLELGSASPLHLPRGSAWVDPTPDDTEALTPQPPPG